MYFFDTQTSFQNFIFIRDNISEGLWQASTQCCWTVYLRLPNELRVDQDVSFHSEKVTALVDVHGVTLQFSGVESHNSITKGERYHTPLRRVFKVLATNNPTMSKYLLLRYAIRGLNDTANIDDLVPLLLVFVIVPSFPSTSHALSNHRARLQSIVYFLL